MEALVSRGRRRDVHRKIVGKALLLGVVFHFKSALPLPACWTCENLKYHSTAFNRPAPSAERGQILVEAATATTVSPSASDLPVLAHNGSY